MSRRRCPAQGGEPERTAPTVRHRFNAHRLTCAAGPGNCYINGAKMRKNARTPRRHHGTWRHTSNVIGKDCARHFSKSALICPMASTRCSHTVQPHGALLMQAQTAVIQIHGANDGGGSICDHHFCMHIAGFVLVNLHPGFHHLQVGRPGGFMHKPTIPNMGSDDAYPHLGARGPHI